MGRIVVMGASQGGVDALRRVVRGLPADFPAPVLVVLHVGAAQSVLPILLHEHGGLSASHALDGEPLQSGHILVAPPDRHMRVIDGHVELTRGPRENWARPAVDPLFRSAAEAFGADVIGVVLTGQLNDGSSGLWEIKRRGGIAIVQDPAEAEAPSMPQSAIDNVEVDFRLPLADIPKILDRLAREQPAGERKPGQRGTHAMPADEPPFDRPTAQICPDCGGAMREERQGSLTRFRCHIGHVMTAEVLAASQLEMLQRDISTVLRALNERSTLCSEMADKHVARGEVEAAAIWRNAAEEAERREQTIRHLAEAAWVHPEQV
jgi:two-component system chemotaxis response regulator CheB